LRSTPFKRRPFGCEAKTSKIRRGGDGGKRKGQDSINYHSKNKKLKIFEIMPRLLIEKCKALSTA
jgi:hypothetical protein